MPKVDWERKGTALRGRLAHGHGGELQLQDFSSRQSNNSHTAMSNKMSAVRSLRSLAARPASRIIFRSQVSTFQHRNASSKHPKGFEAPTSEDLAELRERVQEFTRREITEELAAKTDKSNSFPNEMWQKLGDAGFLGITADEDVGGLGMGYQAHCVVMEEISRYFEAYINTLAARTDS